MSDLENTESKLEDLRAQIKSFRVKHTKHSRVPEVIRESICDAIRQGLSIQEVARLSGISSTSIHRWMTNKPHATVRSKIPPTPQILNVIQPSDANRQVRISCESGLFVIELMVSSTQAQA